MENNQHQSRADLFSKRSGTLISTEFADIGIIGGRIKIMLARFQDLITNQEERAIRFEYDYYSEYADYPDTKIGTLDKDELEGLLKSLKIIVNNIFLTSPANYMEVNFTSRSGLKAGCFYQNKWSFYVKLSEYDSNSFVFLDKECANDLLKLLTNTQDKLISN